MLTQHIQKQSAASPGSIPVLISTGRHCQSVRPNSAAAITVGYLGWTYTLTTESMADSVEVLRLNSRGLRLTPTNRKNNKWH